MSVFIEDMKRPICNVIFIQSDYRQLNVTFKIIVRQRNDMTVIVRQQNDVTIIVRLSSLHTIIASRRRLSYTMRLTRDNRCRIKICEIVNIFDRESADGVSKCLRLITGVLGVDCAIRVGCCQMITVGLAVDYVNIFILPSIHYNNTN